jgi:hypothetical protein
MTDNQITLITGQIESSECKNSKGMRWPKETICMALTLVQFFFNSPYKSSFTELSESMFSLSEMANALA